MYIQLVTRESDRQCSNCASYRKPNYDTLRFYEINLGKGVFSNGMIVRLCDECAVDMVKALTVLEVDGRNQE